MSQTAKLSFGSDGLSEDQNNQTAQLIARPTNLTSAGLEAAGIIDHSSPQV
jgi:hypothetical protein